MVSLIRHRDYSHAAELDPDTGVVREITRRWIDNGFQPVVPEHGWFDRLGGAFVALYRSPDALVFHFDGRSYPIASGTRGELQLSDTERRQPFLPGVGERVFRLYEGEVLLLSHRYQPGRHAERIADALNPIPAWPKDEEDYDFLSFVHAVLAEPGRRERILASCGTAATASI